MSSTIQFRFQCPLAGQQFFIICELIFLCSYSFHFLYFLIMQFTVSIFPNYLFMQVQFFWPELILHKYSVEGYWSEGIVCCTCGHLLTETVANRRFIENTMDLSSPECVIKKGRPHGHRYGKLPENKEYYLAQNLKKICIKREFKGIRDRFLRDHVFCERMIQYNRDEEVCRAWDVLAEQDHTYRMSEAEYFYYRQNWWISLNKSANDTQPVRKSSDFNQALSTLNRLHQEVGGQQLGSIPYWKYKEWRPASSSSSSWWQWRESWWSS